MVRLIGRGGDQVRLKLPREVPPGGVSDWELQSAIDRGTASFSHLASAVFLSRKDVNADEQNRKMYEWYLPRVLAAFEREYGHIIKSDWVPIKPGLADQSLWGAVLTAKYEYNTATKRGVVPEVDDLLGDMDVLLIEARRLLRGKSLDVSAHWIYGVATHVIGLVDRVVSHPEDKTLNETKLTVLAGLKKRVADARAFITRSAVRLTHWDYFVGMMLGLVVVAGVVGAVGFAISSALPFLASIVAGAFGSVVSVMTRMQSGKLKLDFEAGKSLVTLLGAFRPAIGAILGAAFYALVTGGLLPLVVPSNPAVQVHFYAGLAFLGGFSERLAQDMLGQAGGRLRVETTAREAGVEASSTDTPEKTSPRGASQGER